MWSFGYAKLICEERDLLFGPDRGVDISTYPLCNTDSADSDA